MPHSKDITREFHPKARLNITYQKPCLVEWDFTTSTGHFLNLKKCQKLYAYKRHYLYFRYIYHNSSLYPISHCKTIAINY